MAAVSYQQMTEYVRRELEPIEEHMTAHDNWHRTRSDSDLAGGHVNRLTVAALLIAAGSGIGNIILQIVIHR